MYHPLASQPDDDDDGPCVWGVVMSEHDVEVLHAEGQASTSGTSPATNQIIIIIIIII